MNIYNALISVTDTGAIVRALTASSQHLWRSGLIIGDFNLHYLNWDLAHRTPFGQAKVLLDWLDSYSFVYISLVSTPTHNQGNTLDLVFFTSPLLAYTTLTSHLDLTSDHCSLLITVY
jgi:endonuclease/exonuclease/phosphatase family metal-dependent hydrolase